MTCRSKPPPSVNYRHAMPDCDKLMQVNTGVETDIPFNSLNIDQNKMFGVKHRVAVGSWLCNLDVKILKIITCFSV